MTAAPLHERGHIKPLEKRLARYLFAIVAVGIALGIRIGLTRLTGTGAPFVLFFAAVLVTSLRAGVGPGVCSLMISTPVAAYVFGVRAGQPLSQVFVQSLLFAVDGTVVIYLTATVARIRRALEATNRQLQRANEELGQSSARTRDVLALAPDAFFLAGLDDRLVEVNEEACKMLGYERDELIGKAVSDLLSPGEASRLARVKRELHVPGTASRAEWIHLRKDGTPIPVEVSSNMLPGGRWQAFVRDISDRKRMERELQESEQKFRTLAESIPQMVWITKPDGWNTYFNQQWVEYTGLTLEQSYGHGWNIPFHPDDRQRSWEAWQRAVQTDGVYSLECRLRRADGAYRWWLIRGASLHDESGRVVSWFGTCTDVDDIKRTEEALRRARDEMETANGLLRESEERFRLTIDDAPIGMALVALDGRFVRVNRGLSEIVGYEQRELIQRSFQDITHPDDLDADVALAGRLARGEIPRYTLEKRYIRKDGTVVDVDVSVSILRGPDGAALYYISQVEDITERKRAEAALKESERRLTLALDSARMGIWDSDLVSNTTIRSPRHDEIFGYSSPVAKWDMDFLLGHVVPEDRDLVRRRFAEAFASGVFGMECRLRWKDGSIHWISSQGRVYRNARNIPFRMLGTIMDITRRKRAEEALRRSETQFRGLIERMPDGVYINQGGNIVYANQALATLLGYEGPVGIVGKHITELFHPDDWSIVDARIRVLEQGLSVSPQELRMARKDGSFGDIETSAIQIQFEGRPGIAVIVRDLTERRRSEQALRLSEAKFSGIVSIAADAIISVDDEQRITIFNEGAQRIFGYSQTEAIGESLDLLVPTQFRSLHNRHVVDFSAGGVTARRMGDRLTTITGRRKNGEEFPAEAAISKLKVGDKMLLTVALRDVTERKRFEREQQMLAEAAAMLAGTLDFEQTLATVARLVVRDFADWCIVEVLDERGQLRRRKVASADPASAVLCRRLEKVAIERDLPYLLRPVVDSKEALLLEHVRAEHLESIAQGPEHLEALRAVGPLSIMAVPLLRQGELFGTLAFLSSTPSRIYGQDDLRLAAALADRASVAIENARLYGAAVHATQLRDEVLGVVAHDLRNPLNTILMQATASQRRPPDLERRSRKPQEVIQRAARRMNRLIQDLLDVARMEGGQLSVERKQLAAGALMVEAVEMQRPLAASSDLEVRLDVARELPEVWGDHDRLLQVFENLIGNAMKFTSAGGRIAVGAESREGEVLFWVSDTGCGIAAESLPRVFDRFWQATRAGRSGAGLGLPITKGIVEAHAGRIWVESTLGQGSTFFFTIPRANPLVDRTSDNLH